MSEIISDNEQKTLKVREAVKKWNMEVSNRTVKYFRQQNKWSKYVAGERVLLRLGKKGKKSIKDYVVLGKCTKIGKHGDNYKAVKSRNHQMVFCWRSSWTDLAMSHSRNRVFKWLLIP